MRLRVLQRKFTNLRYNCCNARTLFSSLISIPDLKICQMVQFSHAGKRKNFHDSKARWKISCKNWRFWFYKFEKLDSGKRLKTIIFVFENLVYNLSSITKWKISKIIVINHRITLWAGIEPYFNPQKRTWKDDEYGNWAARDTPNTQPTTPVNRNGLIPVFQKNSTPKVILKKTLFSRLNLF